MNWATLILILLIMSAQFCQDADAWWRRRRRRRSIIVKPSDTTSPTFNVPCPINLGPFRTSTLPQTVNWMVPVATDSESPPVITERLGGVPGSGFAEGDHTITYQARDTVPNYSVCHVQFSVILIKCSVIRQPPRGYVSCSQGNLVGSTCRYSCFQGYAINVGSRDRTCVESNEAASWTGSEPRCEELTCPATAVSAPPENGQVSCTRGNLFQSVCTYTCDSGYTIPPGQTRDRLCTTSGWTGTTPTCEDTSAPTFDDCPPSQILYAEDRQETAVATWTPPTASDNSGAAITNVQHEGPTPGSSLPQGHYVVTYTARDDGGNEATCVFSITVQVIHCATIPITPGLLVNCPHGNLRGSICTFSCSMGYRLDGADTTTCERISFSGTWTNQPPVCQELQCPALTAPENGGYLNGQVCRTSYGSSCYFECLPGFRINNNVLRCIVQAGSEEAFWEGTQPVCEVETCDRPSLSGPLEVPDNSSVCGAMTQIPAGDECEFECSPGYFLQGTIIATCGLTGSWAQPLPTCEVVTCLGSNLPAPLNGGKSGCPHDQETYGTVCILFCDVGHQPSESSPVRRTCEDDGQGSGVWSGGPITCTIVQCLPLDVPTNGYNDNCQLDSDARDPTSRQDYGTTCTVHCNTGYTAMGTTTRRCLADGQWDGVQQTCVDLTAPILHCPADEVIVAEVGHSVGTVHWDQVEPVEATDAGMTITAQLESIDSEAVSGARPTTLAEGDHALVYRATDLAGNTDSCSFNIQVRVARCRPLYAPANGDVTLVSGQGSCEGGAVLGSSCRVSCDLGYNPSTEAALLVCERTDNGTTVGMWNGSTPTCQVATCDVRPLTNSTVSGCPFSSVDYGEHCRFICDDGFLSSSGTKSATRTCQADGSLSGEDLTCDDVVTCPSGFTLTHGTVTPDVCTVGGTTVPYDTACHFLCNSGFLQYGPFVKECTVDGTWSDTRPVICEDRQQPSFDDPCPRYITVNAERGTLTALVDFTAPTATDNSGSVTVRSIAGFQGPNTTFTEGTVVTSYTATDPSGNSANCEINVRVNVFRCPRLQAPASGSLVNCTDPIYGSQCSFSCNEGYRLLGPVTRTCDLSNGQAPASWDGTRPSCEPRTCPALQTPDLAVKSGCSQEPPDTEIFGTLCSFYCPFGYFGVGESQKRCQADGTWTSTDFSCQATACGPLTPPPGASISPANCLNDPVFGETCLLHCNTPGFQIQPQLLSHTVCLGTGRWSRNISAVVCVDVESPTFTECPNDFNVYADRGAFLGNVTWHVVATDNDPTSATILCDNNQGLKPEGDHDVTCTATDATQNTQTCSFEVSVRVRRCPYLAPPVFGSLVGSCDNSWGSQCQVECPVGYSLVGPSMTTCEYDGQLTYWERDSTPYCDVVGCDPFTIPPAVSVYPATCSGTEKVYFGTQCNFFCRDELTVEGAVTSVSCGAEGTWNFNVSESDITCRDEVAPTLLSCPGPQSVIRVDVWGVEVTFEPPTAVDNTPANLTVVTTPENVTSPYNFTEDTTISYVFSDAAGNSVTCSFPIYVQDEIPPVVVYCPPDMTFNTSETLTEVTWDPPIFEEVTGDQLLITSNYEEDMATLPWGRHVVTYQATNTDNSKSAVCQFVVEIMPVTCKDLSPPGNGALACDEWAYGRFCSILCNSNFDIPRLPDNRRPPQQYVCGSTGLWSPHAYVPDCSQVRRPRRSTLPNELLYYTGDCMSQETRDLIAAAFIQILLDTDFSDICTQSDECSIENVRVTCGPVTAPLSRRRRQSSRSSETSQRRKMHGAIAKIEAVLGRMTEHGRVPRSADPLFQFSIEWDFAVNIDQDPTLSNFDAALGAEDIMAGMNGVILSEIQAGTFPSLNVSGVNVTLDVDSLTFDYSEVVCGHGMTADNNDLQCVPCVAGTFYDNVTEVCQLCPKGYYQEEAGQMSCVQCDEGQSTKAEGATNSTQCRDVCTAGHFSSAGVIPCYSCVIGTYQPEALSTSCLHCRNGTTTLSPASVSSAQCMESCSRGSFSATGFAPCDLCPAGSYQSLIQQSTCDLCPGNLTTNDSGAASIEQCTDVNECAANPCQNGALCLDLASSYQCNCVPGYTGQDCEIELDECTLLQPCLHNGTCTDLVNGYSCICGPGFTGAVCGEAYDVCETSLCENNATCVSSPSHYECQCLEGYHGVHCEFELQPCFPSPCHNGATCSVTLGEATDYRCSCAPGFSGNNCSREINECQSNPCRNGGTCQDDINQFTCSCTEGYTGSQCEVNLDLCANQPCQNSGACYDLGDVFQCSCQPGFAGERCERERNVCDDQPCQNNGQCATVGESGQNYECRCVNGFIGQDCEINRDDCASGPCSNEATCTDGVDEYICLCPAGFRGPTCDEDIDECATTPCGTNATCIDQIAGFLCRCPPGWTGDDCSEMYDYCLEEQPCMNGATCLASDDVYSCLCPNGYQGPQCEVDINECITQPCLHGATCLDRVSTFACRCAPGFNGTLCEENLDDCQHSPCSNGSCIDGVDSFSCACNQGYTGVLCNIPIDYCSGTPCMNNGICTNMQTGYSCQCLSGYTGDNCELNINECLSFPCFQGSCEDQIAGYRCVCREGFSGIHCQVDLDECDGNPCDNDATCVDGPGSYACQCVSGFEGQNCEINVDDCIQNECQNNGTCVDGIDAYRCVCPPGFNGTLCQLEASPACSSSPCLNGGQCVEGQSGQDGYTCLCLLGFSGVRCHEDVDDCETAECQNGATCVDQINNYTCQCLAGFDGSYCEEDVNECASQPCMNNATCVDQVAGYTCQCVDGFTGELCETDIEECASNPCRNLGSCEDRVNGFVCQCAAGFSGDACETQSQECDSNPCLNGATCHDGFQQYVCDCAPGYTGLRCETALPTDFDLVFNGQSQVIQPAEVLTYDVTQVTLSTWLYSSRAPEDFRVFGYFVDNNEYSLYNPCHLQLMSDSTSYNISISLCDNAWHHVSLTWSINQINSWALTIDQSQPIAGNDTMTARSSATLGRFEIGSNNMQTADYVLISAYNLWSTILPSDVLLTLSSTCTPSLFGDIVSWPDVVLDRNIPSHQIDSPSRCDDTDECVSNPCQRGTCQNKLNSYHCECPRGSQGLQCDLTRDLCSAGLCNNGGTCISAKGSVSCLCPDRFSGEYCQTGKVDGNWAGWSLWSECTATCDGGTRNRTRQCTNPAPQGGGLNCTGKGEDEETCNDFPCPGCIRLKRPLRGYLECQETVSQTACTIRCRTSYGFAERIQDSYTCGRASNYRWSHQTNDNPRALLPSCTELTHNRGATGIVSIGYPSAVCQTANDVQILKNAAYETLMENSNQIGCLGDNSCRIMSIQVRNCQLRTYRRRSVRSSSEVTISITVTQNATVEDLDESDNSTEPVEPLDIFYTNLTALINEGSMALEINNEMIASDPTSVTGDAWENCPSGYLESVTEGFCVPCGVGTYFGRLENATEFECHPCPDNTYQDQEAQDDCVLCPDDTYTVGMHSVNFTDCKVIIVPVTTTLTPVTPVYPFPLPVIIGIAVGACILFLLLILVPVIWCKCCPGHKRSQTENNVIQLLNAASANADGNHYNYVYTADTRTNHGFTFGAEAPATESPEKPQHDDDFVFGAQGPPPAYSLPGTVPVEETEFTLDDYPVKTPCTFAIKKQMDE